MSKHVLLCDDEARIREVASYALAREGYKITEARDGADAVARVERGGVDALVLDVMMPELDGLEACRRIRSISGPAARTPILFLSARAEEIDRIVGLELGGDDYLVKPFSFDELLARLRALLRRAAPAQPEALRFADLALDTGTRQAFRNERPIELTAKEYELLELFMRHPRQVLTREVIYDRVWGYDFGGESNIIEVYVRYLRQKTEANGEPRLLHTVRGVGYVLREE